MVRSVVAAISIAAALCPFVAHAEGCGAMPCRANGAPYVTDRNAVVIYPGEKFAVPVDVAGGKIGDAKPASEAGESGTITLDFKTIDTGMMLVVDNHLAETLKYDATMKGPDGRRVYTSSCPVTAGLSAFEGWPHTIQYLELSNFRLLPEGAEHRCE